ncbi:MAG: metallophosphoesterase [Proteobacteria bacterium]|nr:metallophosphoesterase [Pseudomonadota bacterium]
MKKQSILAFVALLFLVLVYSIFIEPQWLEVTNYSVRAEVSFPLKIAHITDLHLKKNGRLEQRVLMEIRNQKPDVIFVTGDSIDDPRARPVVKSFFNSLKAPLGVWVVRGNWENWNPLSEERAFWSEAGAQLLVNQVKKLKKDINIIGYDDEMSGKPNRQITSVPTKDLRLCLFHSPAFFDHVYDYCDLSFSGHTHGGHFRLPFWGPLWLPPGSGKYLWGWYRRESSQMYVSRGLGNSILPLRFLARPELSFIFVSR